MLRKFLYYAFLACVALLAIAALDVLLEREVALTPRKMPLTSEQRRV